jgi:hypothetical protein
MWLKKKIRKYVEGFDERCKAEFDEARTEREDASIKALKDYIQYEIYP